MASYFSHCFSFALQPYPSQITYKTHNLPCQLSTSTVATGDGGTTLTDVCTNAGAHGHSEFPIGESLHGQVMSGGNAVSLC